MAMVGNGLFLSTANNHHEQKYSLIFRGMDQFVKFWVCILEIISLNILNLSFIKTYLLINFKISEN
jgi:hypothetical protein